MDCPECEQKMEPFAPEEHTYYCSKCDEYHEISSNED